MNKIPLDTTITGKRVSHDQFGLVPFEISGADIASYRIERDPITVDYIRTSVLEDPPHLRGATVTFKLLDGREIVAPYNTIVITTPANCITNQLIDLWNDLELFPLLT